jgi:co-chaperonin GroES (HSP10)
MSEFILEALHNFVIVRTTNKEQKKGSIYLPDSVGGEQNDFAEVVSVGPACVGDLKVGDVVLCPEVGDIEWTDEDDDDRKYILIEETGIAARVNDWS